VSHHSPVRALYVKYLRGRFKDPLYAQRLKILWFAAGYFRLLFINKIPFGKRIALLYLFFRVDWHVLHGHRPSQIMHICRALCALPHVPAGIVVEAGCWQGGSSCKLSILCEYLGYQLYIYDSFQGVEPIKEGAYDYSGQYASTEQILRHNLSQYGVIGVCEIYRGWFSETLAKGVTAPICAAYIDCDLAKGTYEALQGILPSLVDGGAIFSQDYQIAPVRQLFADPKTWEAFHRPTPVLRQHDYQLVSMRFKN
jgi:O-methyltransferase